MRGTIVISYISRGITPDRGQRKSTPDQKHQLLLVTLRRLGQCLQQRKRLVEIAQRLNIACTLGRALAGCLPVLDRRRDQARLREVIGQHLGLRRNPVGKPLLQRLGDARMKFLALAPQQGGVCGILNKRMLEFVRLVGRVNLAVDQLGGSQLQQSFLELLLRKPVDGAEQLEGKLAADGGGDLDFTSRTDDIRSRRASSDACRVLGIACAPDDRSAASLRTSRARSRSPSLTALRQIAARHRSYRVFARAPLGVTISALRRFRRWPRHARGSAGSGSYG